MKCACKTIYFSIFRQILEMPRTKFDGNANARINLKYYFGEFPTASFKSSNGNIINIKGKRSRKKKKNTKNFFHILKAEIYSAIEVY